jgi:hypothetical protein
MIGDTRRVGWLDEVVCRDMNGLGTRSQDEVTRSSADSGSREVIGGSWDSRVV